MFILNGVTLPNPNAYSQPTEVGGGYVTTLLGGTRRAIRYKKKTYTLEWSNLSVTDLANILSIYNLDTTVTFVNTDLSIDTTVHIDVSDRVITPGLAEYSGQYSITLTEV